MNQILIGTIALIIIIIIAFLFIGIGYGVTWLLDKFEKEDTLEVKQ